MGALEGVRVIDFGQYLAGPFGPMTWDATTSAISWLGPHEREHAEMIAKL